MAGEVHVHIKRDEGVPPQAPPNYAAHTAGAQHLADYHHRQARIATSTSQATHHLNAMQAYIRATSAYKLGKPDEAMKHMAVGVQHSGTAYLAEPRMPPTMPAKKPEPPAGQDKKK